MEYVDISRLSLDYKNVILSDFKKLHTLIIDYTAISQISLEEIPSNIETLEFMKSYNTKVNKFEHVKYVKNNLEYLRTHRHIKRLTIPYILFEECNIGHFLPSYLEELTITSNDISTYQKNNTKTSKSCVKKLVLQFMFESCQQEIEEMYFLNKKYVDYFDYLRNFIDFDKLEQFVIETKTDMIYLDAKTYRVK